MAPKEKLNARRREISICDFLRRLLAAILDQFIILIPAVIVAFTVGVMIGILIPDASKDVIDAGANILGIVASVALFCHHGKLQQASYLW